MTPPAHPPQTPRPPLGRHPLQTSPDLPLERQADSLLAPPRRAARAPGSTHARPRVARQISEPRTSTPRMDKTAAQDRLLRAYTTTALVNIPCPIPHPAASRLLPLNLPLTTRLPIPSFLISSPVFFICSLCSLPLIASAVLLSFRCPTPAPLHITPWLAPQFYWGVEEGSPARKRRTPFLESPGVKPNPGRGWGSGLLTSLDQPIEINN